MSLPRLNYKWLPTTLCEDGLYVDLIETYFFYIVTINKEGLLVFEYSLERAMPIIVSLQFCLSDIVVHQIEVMLSALQVILSVILASKLKIFDEVIEYIRVIKFILFSTEPLKIIFQFQHGFGLPVCELPAYYRVYA